MKLRDLNGLPPAVIKFRFDELTRRVLRAKEVGWLTNQEIAEEFDCTLSFVDSVEKRGKRTVIKRSHKRKQR